MLQMTSFGCRTLAVAVSDREMQKEYIPIYPSLKHPISGLQLSLKNSLLLKASYIQKKCFILPIEVLAHYSIRSDHFDAAKEPRLDEWSVRQLLIELSRALPQRRVMQPQSSPQQTKRGQRPSTKQQPILPQLSNPQSRLILPAVAGALEATALTDTLLVVNTTPGQTSSAVPTSAPTTTPVPAGELPPTITPATAPALAPGTELTAMDDLNISLRMRAQALEDGTFDNLSLICNAMNIDITVKHIDRATANDAGQEELHSDDDQEEYHMPGAFPHSSTEERDDHDYVQAVNIAKPGVATSTVVSTVVYAVASIVMAATRGVTDAMRGLSRVGLATIRSIWENIPTLITILSKIHPTPTASLPPYVH